MLAPWTKASNQVRALARHLKAYADIAVVDMSVEVKEIRKRFLAGLVAMAGATLGLILGCAWIFGVVWSTPWRNPVLAAMLGLFFLCTVIGAAIANRPRTSGKPPFANLRRELSLDRIQLDELIGQDNLRQTRGELLQLLQPSGAATADNSFPRSTTLRLLLAFSGLGRKLMTA